MNSKMGREKREYFNFRRSLTSIGGRASRSTTRGKSAIMNYPKPAIRPKQACYKRICLPFIAVRQKVLATGSAKRDLYAKPTASRGAAQLWVVRIQGAVPRSGTYAIGGQQDV